MGRKQRHPLQGPLGILGKFVASFLFGCLVSFTIFCFAMIVGVPALLQRPWVHILWIIPTIWGGIGIFLFDQMLELARAIFEGSSS